MTFKPNKNITEDLLKQIKKNMKEKLSKEGFSFSPSSSGSKENLGAVGFENYEQLDKWIGKGEGTINWDTIKELGDTPEWFKEKHKDHYEE